MNMIYIFPRGLAQLEHLDRSFIHHRENHLCMLTPKDSLNSPVNLTINFFGFLEGSRITQRKPTQTRKGLSQESN